jgi:hypothetical protein
MEAILINNRVLLKRYFTKDLSWGYESSKVFLSKSVLLDDSTNFDANCITSNES